MPTNYRQFQLEVGRFPRVLETVSIRVARNTATAAYRFMAPLMRVDTGLMRGNLQITTRGPARRVLRRFADGGRGIPSPTDEEFLNQELGKFSKGLTPYPRLFVGTPVEYAIHVNDGTPTFEGDHYLEETQLFLQSLRFTQQELGFAAFPDVASQLGERAGADV